MTISASRYDESMKTRVIGATEFKAKCLALLDEIDEQGGTITVTKRGRPVATVTQAPKKKWKSPIGILEGKVKIVGDIVNFDSSDLWDALRQDEDSPS
jgi:prevent-host-death family protein